MKRFIVAAALLALVGIAGFSTASFAADCSCKPNVTSQPLTEPELAR